MNMPNQERQAKSVQVQPAPRAAIMGVDIKERMQDIPYRVKVAAAVEDTPLPGSASTR